MNGALHVVEISGQTTDRLLQLSDLLSVTLRHVKDVKVTVKISTCNPSMKYVKKHRQSSQHITEVISFCQISAFLATSAALIC